MARGPQAAPSSADVNSFFLSVSRGLVPGHSVVHKFGENSDIGTSVEVVASAATYQTPTSAVSLEFLSAAEADALSGAGMHSLTIEGLDANWNLQTTTISAHATDGRTVVAIPGTWIRVFRAYVSSSGTYASASSPSHVGAVTIRVASGGATWAIIPTIQANFGAGQSLIAAYTVPAGYTAYMLKQNLTVDGNKAVDFYFFKRENADDTTSSYSGVMRVQAANIGIKDPWQNEHLTFDAYPEKTDIGYLAKASQSADVSAEFEIMLVKDESA
jgi:hypothetical protein